MTTHLLERVSTAPGGALQIHVDAETPTGTDAGLGQAGTFYFAPGDKVGVSAHVARVIMGDAGLAPHFRCTPPLDAPEPVKTAKATKPKDVDASA